MQKTEKHCKNQCFCYHKKTKISPKTGPKTQKSASGPGHLRNRKKRCCKPKNWGQKVEKHGFFSLFACRFWTGAFTNRCLPYCFLQCFLKASVTTYQKQEVLAEKCPPPGKPVTFYECHPEDHTPAPSVRADFRYSFLLKNKIMEEVIKIWFVAGYSENFYMQNSFKSWNKSSNTYLNKHWNSMCVGECLPMTLGNAS